MLAETERAKVRRFIFVSSLGAPTGESEYHRSKREAEALVRHFRGAVDDLPAGQRLRSGRRADLAAAPDGAEPEPRSCRGSAMATSRSSRSGGKTSPTRSRPSSSAPISRTRARPRRRRAHVAERPDRATSPHHRPRRAQRSVPDFLASLGSKVVSLVGWDMPFNEQQVHDAARGQRDRAGRRERARPTSAASTPTPLDEGLRSSPMLQPEQLPSEGIGALKRKRFWADIAGTSACAGVAVRALPHALQRRHCRCSSRRRPSRRTTDLIDEGETHHARAADARSRAGARRGARAARHATLLTLEGHPLAGAVRFRRDAARGRGALPGRGLRPRRRT